MTLNLQPWAVAAAILLIDNDRRHYKELTKKVQATSLSSLGGETPPVPKTEPQNLLNTPEGVVRKEDTS